MARLKARWLPGTPSAAKESGGVPRERCGGWQEERAGYEALDPEGLFFGRAMGLGEEEEEWDGGPGDLMDVLPLFLSPVVPRYYAGLLLLDLDF